MERRDFIRGTTLAGLGLITPFTVKWDLFDEKTGMPMGILGRTGEKVSKLGFGCFPFSWDELTTNDVVTLLSKAVEEGITYIDTAPNYKQAEEKMGHIVPEIRDKIFLVTKTEDGTHEGTWSSINRSLERMKTDHLDLVHLHNFGNTTYFPEPAVVFSDKGALGALRRAREEGLVRFFGASGHVWPSRFHYVLDTGEFDVLMNAVNYIIQHVYDFEDKIWSRAMQDNLGLVAMKVLGGLRGPGNRDHRIPDDDYELAIRYALSVPGVSNAVIGIKTMDELNRAVETVKRIQPFNEEERYDAALKGLKLSRLDNWKTVHGKPLT